MGYPQEVLRDASKHRFSVHLYDKPDALDARNTHSAEHKQRLVQFKAQWPGVIEFGGPMLHPETYQPIGSVFVLKRGEAFPSLEAVDRWIEQDAYHAQGIWTRREVSLFLANTMPMQLS